MSLNDALFLVGRSTESLETEYFKDADIQHNIFNLLNDKGYVDYERKKFTDEQQKEIDEIKRKMAIELEEIEKNWHSKGLLDNESNRPYWELQEKYGKRLKEIYDSVK